MTVDLRRRRLVASLTAPLLGGCASLAKPLCPTDPLISDLQQPLTIDAHAHIFNGSDLQVAEFLIQTTDRTHAGTQSEFTNLVKALGAGFLQSLAWHAAPNARAEREALARYAAETEDCARAGAVDRASSAAHQEGYDLGVQQLQAAKERLRTRVGPSGVLGPDVLAPALSETIDALPKRYEDFQRRRAREVNALGGTAHLTGYLDFVLHHFNYRHVNALEYLTTYSAGARKVDLVVACMVDYDWWLAGGRRTATTLEEQVDLMARIAVVTGGRVHGFAPFCPFREAMTKGASREGESMKLVRDAVMSRGFVGVKLYPPMGFAPWGNTALNVWAGKPTLPKAAWEPGFGARLDEAMESLFRWCIDYDVPVMAHANESNAPYADFAALAGSRYWGEAIHKKEFSGLRASFGHFGDSDLEEDDGKGALSFLDLMSDQAGADGRNLFADTGYFGGVLDNPVALARVMSELYERHSGADLRQRLMYGTDWTMILPLQRVESYLAEFEGVMRRVVADHGQPATVQRDFFGRNAARFLGLTRGAKTRARLDQFYERNSVNPPDWVKKVDSA